MANITVPIQVNLPDDWVEQIVDRLRNDPESEWVEIVRCKDCCHYKTSIDSFGREYKGCDFWMNGRSESPCEADDYCSYAKRRAG